ncbi:TetR/AcrR family transcriptional regulator [Nocardioides sp.]|uniref:TetR/AcrR family transcriptional regulator n=1 Tax=Nocardioides sp. TaxID=35761 RepID=UPI003518BAD3
MDEREPDAVTDGAFFHVPAALPRGRHGLSREEVLAAQRERAMIAVTELLAAHGVDGIGVRDVAKRAGLSLSAFYAIFADKQECVFAAYDRFIGVLLTRLVEVRAEGRSWEEYVHDVVAAYFDTLAADLVVARAFQVAMDALGAPARARRRESLTAMADLLQAKHRDWDADAAAALPASAYLAGVYGVRQLASDTLDDPAGRPLAEIAAEATAWVALLYGAAGQSK